MNRFSNKAVGETSAHRNMFYFNGWLVAGVILLTVLGGIFSLLRGSLGMVPLITVGVLLFSGFRIIQPNTALVSTCFGRYSGVLAESGFFWIVPVIYQTQKVSLRTNNYTTPTLKVNDASGTPIEISAAVVYRISNPAAAVLDVENVHSFIQVQSESALRTLASHYPYTAQEGESLSRHSEHILHEFREMVQERVELAGIEIDEARFTHLAYAPEIAQVMLRKQQAEAVIAARHTLVRGAIGMVGGTLRELEQRNIVKMSDSEKAKLATNMMTVLLSEENAAPVLNVSGD